MLFVSKDEIVNFLPRRKPRLIILGTMGSISARTIEGRKPIDAFYYHSNRNHFWKILQLTFDPTLEPKTFSTDEKRAFLNRWRIGMGNIVHSIQISPKDANDPSDHILFKARKNGRLEFKTINSEFKKALIATPIFFTCRPKTEIQTLLDGYFKRNGLDLSLGKGICFLPSPTRCNPRDRSLVWKKEIKHHMESFSLG